MLYLNSNQIKEIKDVIPSVKILDLEDNLITVIPKFLANSRVRQLSLANNRIRRIPKFIEDFGIYFTIDLTGNPLDNHSRQKVTKFNEQGFKILI